MITWKLGSKIYWRVLVPLMFAGIAIGVFDIATNNFAIPELPFYFSIIPFVFGIGGCALFNIFESNFEGYDKIQMEWKKQRIQELKKELEDLEKSEIEK